MAHRSDPIFLELLRGDAAAALATADGLAALARDHDGQLASRRELYAVWARCRLDDRDGPAQSLASTSQRARSCGWFSKTLLAELECRRTARTVRSRASTKRWSVASGSRKSHFEARTPHRMRGEISAQARPRRKRSLEGSLPNRHRRRKAAGCAQLRIARGAVAGQALSIDRPPRRRPRRPRPRARRLFAIAGNARDRRGSGAAGGVELRRTRSERGSRSGSD